MNNAEGDRVLTRRFAARLDGRDAVAPGVTHFRSGF